MANFWLNVLSEMESLTSDDDHTVLSLTWAVDLDFGLVDPLFKKIEACLRSLVSKPLTNPINPNKLVTEKSCYLRQHATYVKVPFFVKKF